MTDVSSVGRSGAAVSAPAGGATARAAKPLDQAKLDALKAAIQAGRYPLDAARLADRIATLGPIGK